MDTPTNFQPAESATGRVTQTIPIFFKNLIILLFPLFLVNLIVSVFSYYYFTGIIYNIAHTPSVMTVVDILILMAGVSCSMPYRNIIDDHTCLFGFKTL